MRIWDAVTGEETRRFDWLVGRRRFSKKSRDGTPVNVEIRTAAFSPDGRHLVSLSTQSTARAWNAATGDVCFTARGCQFATFTPDSRRILVGGPPGHYPYLRFRHLSTGADYGTIGPNAGKVLGATFNPDGAQLAVFYADNCIRLWDVVTRQLIGTLRGHRAPVHSVAFSPDGRRLVSCSMDGTARIWNVDFSALLADSPIDGDEVRETTFVWRGGRRHFLAVSKPRRYLAIWDVASARQRAVVPQSQFPAAPTFSPDGKKLVTGEGSVLDAQTGEVLSAILEANTGILVADTAVREARVSPDGRLIAAACMTQIVRIHSTANGELVSLLSAHEDRINDARFSPDSKRLITASADETARVWDVESGAEIAVIEPGCGALTAAWLASDNQRAILLSRDGTAIIWNVATGEQVEILQHEKGIRAVDVDRAGRRVLAHSIGLSPDVTVFDAFDGKRLWEDKPTRGLVVAARFSPDGERVVTCRARDTREACLQLRRADAGELLLDVTFPRAMADAVVSPDGETILVSFGDSVQLLDADTGEPRSAILPLDGVTLRVDRSPLAFSPDSQSFAVAFQRYGAVLGDTLGSRYDHLEGHAAEIRQIDVSPDGTCAVTASFDGTVRIWDVATRRPLHTLRILDAESPWRPRPLARFNADGTRLLTTWGNTRATVWDAITGERLVVLEGHSKPLRDALFSPDDTRVVTASVDATARIWDTVSGRLMRVLEGHESPLFSAAFDGKGRRLVTTTARWSSPRAVGPRKTLSSDNTARIWDLETGKCIVLRHDRGLAKAMFSPDGRRVLTQVGHAGTSPRPVRIWDPATGDHLFSLSGRESGLVFADFSTDGRQIVTLSRESSISVWDTQSGHLLLSFPLTKPSCFAKFCANNQEILTIGADGKTHLWPLDPLAAALVRKPRELTPEECSMYGVDQPYTNAR